MDERVARVNSLIRKIQKGDEKAADILFVEFGALFLAMAKKYLFNKEYAEDLISEVFLELLRLKARSFNDSFNGLNWMFTIIRNKAYRYNAQTYNSVPIEESESPKMLNNFMSAFADNQEKEIDKLVLSDALKTLSVYENELLYYVYWEGNTIREIAKKIGKSRSTVHYELKAALKKLKKLLEE